MWQDAVNSIMSGDFLLGLFQILMAVVVSIVNLLLYPFGLIIAQFMPSLNDGLAQVSQYFHFAGLYIAWVINAFAVPSLAITLIASYYFFSFSTTFATWTVKLIIKWKHAIWG